MNTILKTESGFKRLHVFLRKSESDPEAWSFYMKMNVQSSRRREIMMSLRSKNIEMKMNAEYYLML